MRGFLRPAAAAALLAALLVPSPGEAQLGFWKCRNQKCITRDKIKDRAGQEFERLLGQIEREQKDDPMKALYLSQTKATQKRFNSQADAVLRKDVYAEWEFKYIGQRVTRVIIPTIKAAVAASEGMPAKDRPAAFKAMAANGAKREENFKLAFLRNNSAEMTASLDTSAEAAPDGGAALHELAHGEAAPRAFLRRRLMTPEEQLEASDVAKLAEASANYVLKPPSPGAPDGQDGKPGAPDEQEGKPDDGAAPPPAAGSGAGPSAPEPSVPEPGGLVAAIASPAGVSRLFTNHGFQALEDRNYPEAAEMAQRALELDASNEGAAALSHASKGRATAVASGDASMRVAAGGASSLAAASSGAGSFGAPFGARAGAGSAAAGAARLGGEQAFSAASSAMALNDSSGALAVLGKELAARPDNPRLLHLRASVHASRGDWAASIADADAGLALAPNNPALLLVKAFAQNRAKDYRGALRTAELAVAVSPRNAWAFANRAHALAGLGDREGMLSDLRRAAALDPRFEQAVAEAALLQLPSDSDVMFLFPGENPRGAAASGTAAEAPSRGKSFRLVMGAAIAGGSLLALGLLTLALSALKRSAVSAFTRPVPARPAPGAGSLGLIRGQFEISKQIGEGGMGMVYEGTDKSLGRRVAIKKMRDELRINPRERARFVIEAKTVASLHHPNIVDIYAIAEEGEDVYLVFEYVDGKTVHELVQSKGRLSPADALRIAAAMGEALTYAHSRGVIHRDMKPSNVMLDSSGRVKVMDFGIARMAKDALTRYSMTNNVVGTPPYMAPEQEQGQVRKESDVYSLAICAYEMLTGKLPFIGIAAGMLMNKINMSYVPPSRAIAGLPQALDEVFLKAFQADPDRRYRTPQEFVAALTSALGSVPKSV